MECWCGEGGGLKLRRGGGGFFCRRAEEEAQIDEWTRCVPSFTHKNHTRGTCQEALQLIAFNWKMYCRGGPVTSVLLMKRWALLGSLLAPSPCSLSLPGSCCLERRGWRGCRGRTAQPRSAADTRGRGGHSPRDGRSREREASSLPQPGQPFRPGVPALRRPLASCSRMPRGPRGAGAGRAHLGAEVPRYPSRGHCAAGRQVG